jgi:hypothetical protein
MDNQNVETRALSDDQLDLVSAGAVPSLALCYNTKAAGVGKESDTINAFAQMLQEI